MGCICFAGSIWFLDRSKNTHIQVTNFLLNTVFTALLEVSKNILAWNSRYLQKNVHD